MSTARARRFSRMQSVGPEPELRLVAARAAGAQFIDVGANAGLYTGMALDARASSVIAVEPIPELAALLRTKFGRRVSVLECAMSAEPGESTLTVPVVHGVVRQTRASLSTGDAPVGSTVRVSLATLDSLSPARGAMVKVDVEGHELDVMAGAAKTLESKCVSTWLIEAEVRNQPTAVSDLSSMMDGYGYTGWAVLPDTLIPVRRFDPAVHQSTADQDVVAQGGPRPAGYANNFCFVPQEDEEPFLAACEAHGFATVRS
ncbi:MAG: FkbM family methyltransferase [Microthrixaceae bacterium]|nr:FkbM family methyltransferase [Microthrixaceae bacterium]